MKEGCIWSTALWVFYALVCRCESLQKLNITINSETVLRDEDLLDCYERSDPTRLKERLDVNVSINILDIDQIVEDRMEFRVHCYVKVHWKNRRINMNVENHVRPILLPRQLSNCMWKPDIMFPNTKEITSFVDMLPNVGYKYFSDGEFYRTERYMLRVECPMMFNLYPLDTQHCYIKISLLTSPDEDVKLAWYIQESCKQMNPAVKFVYNIEPLQFNVEKPKTHSVTFMWYTGNFTELWTNITFHRRFTGSVINFYIPSTLVVVLSSLSFYIDVEAAPARVSLGVTALLTITTQMVQARTILPPVQYITALDIWLFACLSIVFASFIEYSIAYSYRKRPNAVISKVKDLEPRPYSGPSSIRPNGKVWPENEESADNSEKINQSDKDVKREMESESINVYDKHSRWLFPLISCVFAITYWWYLLKASEIFTNSGDNVD